MGEALICRRGGGASATPYTGQTEWIYTGNGIFVVPTDGEYEVLCVGGGGGGYSGSAPGGGGGAGCSVTAFFVLSKDVQIPITIGSGGAKNVNGGTSSFGSLLTATGGLCGTINSITGEGSTRKSGGDSGQAILQKGIMNIRSVIQLGGVGGYMQASYYGGGGGGGTTSPGGDAVLTTSSATGGAGGQNNGGGGGAITTRGIGNGYGGNGANSSGAAANATGPGGGGGGGHSSSKGGGAGYAGRVTIKLTKQINVVKEITA